MDSQDFGAGLPGFGGFWGAGGFGIWDLALAKTAGSRRGLDVWIGFPES